MFSSECFVWFGWAYCWICSTFPEVLSNLFELACLVICIIDFQYVVCVCSCLGSSIYWFINELSLFVFAWFRVICRVARIENFRSKIIIVLKHTSASIFDCLSLNFHPLPGSKKYYFSISTGCVYVCKNFRDFSNWISLGTVVVSIWEWKSVLNMRQTHEIKHK